MKQRGTNFRLHAVAVAAVMSGGLILSACGSSSSSNVTTTTGTKSPGNASQLSTLTKAAGKGQGATFSATWSSTSSGSTQSITLEQSPPKSKFTTTGGGFVLNDGTSTYFCSGTTTCLKEPSGTNPLAGLLNLYNGSTFLSAVSAYKQVAFLRAAGIHLSYSSANYSGVASTCLKITARSSVGVKWCVSKKGILTYWSSGSASFTLTHYSSSVAASDFQLPSGATITTVP
jgi:hypothetical protein